MLLKRWISFLFLGAFLSVQAQDGKDLLSALKQEQLQIDKETNKLESDNLKYDWVNQIMGSYTYTDSNQLGYTKKSELYSLTFDQPFFKSGGIYYAIKYSGANREFLKLSTYLSEQSLIKSVISSWLMIKRYDLQIEKQNFLIENAKIDILRKKEQYESGFLDSSFLDNAILSKSALRKSLIEMESARYTQLMSFESLSDADYMKVKPPKFSMVDMEDFLKASLNIQQQKAQMRSNEYLKEMQIANYLPTFSLVGGFYKKEDEYLGMSTQDSYNSVGVRVSMPLVDVNRGRNIELRQLAYLKSKLQLQDKKIEETKAYKEAIKKIELLQKRIDIAQEDIELYDSLLFSTQELYSAGEKTIYDVDTLKNSKQTLFLDKKIYEIDVQLALLELYAKMHGKI